MLNMPFPTSRNALAMKLSVEQASQLTGLPAVSVRGFIGKPVITRTNRNFEIYFVNSRFVKNPMITKAIEDAYHAFLMQHKFPFTVLMIDVNPEIVDVNVHPQKLEVRFSDGMLIYNSIVDSVQMALKETELIVNTDLETFGRNGETTRKADLNPHVEIEEKEKSLPHVEPFEEKREVTAQDQYREALRPELHPEAKPKADIYLDGSNVSGTEVREKAAEQNFGGYSQYRRNYADEHFNRTGAGTGADYSSIKHSSDVGRPEKGSGFGFSDFTKAAEEVEKIYESGKETDSADDEYTCNEVPERTFEKNQNIETSAVENRDDSSITENGFRNKEAEEKLVKPQQETLFQDRFLSEKARIEHRIIGQVFETYWLIEYGDKLYIMDQHAAHEKVNFERMMKRLKERKPASQYLNPPILLTLTSDEALMLERFSDYFQNLGFEISNLGGRDFSISAVPTDLPEIGKKELLLEMLDDLNEDTGMTTPDSIYYKIASMSCKAAVKGNNKLSLMEADALISELLTLENPYACPHGRPTLISMSKYELEKKFKRIV